MTRKIWFITGISRGFGYELAKAVLDKGDLVVGTTRDGTVPPQLAPYRPAPHQLAHGGLTVLPLEMTDIGGIERIVAEAAGLHGRIDVLVNNAGYGLLGPVAGGTAAEIEHVFAVNVHGPLAVIRAALPLLRAQGRGHIVNISSIAGIAPAPGSGIYAATKAALWALSQSLAQEVAPLGLWVTVVSPGSFRTDFLSGRSMRRTAGDDGGYAESRRVLDLLAAKDGRQDGDPARGVQAIIQAVEADEPPLDLLIGADAYDRARVRLNRLDEDMERWEAVGRSTAHAA